MLSNFNDVVVELMVLWWFAQLPLLGKALSSILAHWNLVWRQHTP